MASKPSRPLSNSLRIFIAAGSLGAFLGGWALLAHSPNPYGNAQAAPLDAPTQDAQNNLVQLPPLPTPRPHSGSGLRQLQPPQQQPGFQLIPDTQSPQPFGSQFGSPFQQRRMRTGGS
jgi:hypothetical protein